MSADTWLVSDAHTGYMISREYTKAVEQDFIRNWERMIAPEALASLKNIYETLGLDYLGFDFSIRPDGTLNVFEVNPAQNTFLHVNYSHFPYMKDVQQNIARGYNDAVRKLLGSARATA
jgi:hypothetical protein